MKSLSYFFCCVFLIGLTACHHRHSAPAADISSSPSAAGVSRTIQRPAPIPPPRPSEEKTPAALSADSAVLTPAPLLPVQPSVPGLRVARVSVPGRYVALTFDDGPSASLTPRVLDILKRHNAVGTFFVLGQNASANRSVVARAAAEGNEIGVHTWSHIKMTGKSLPAVDSEINRTREVIYRATGRMPKVMRPPYGATNAALVQRMGSHFGMRTILWDVDTLDWRHPGVQKVINTAVGQAKPGSIILVHDIHASTVAAVEGIVMGLQARGFKLVTVSQLMALANSAAGQSADAMPLPAPVADPAPSPEPEQPTAPAAQPAPVVLPDPLPAEEPAVQPMPQPAPQESVSPVQVAEPAAPEALPEPSHAVPAAIRPANESGAASISATDDAAAEEISPAAEATEPSSEELPSVPAGGASISGQDELM